MNSRYRGAPSRLGEGIKQRREELGITQQELARRADRSQQYISDLESGTHDARLSTVMRLADALEVTITQLVRV